MEFCPSLQTSEETVYFKDYLGGFRFVNRWSEQAEKVNHPFITIQYKLIIVEMTSWNESGLTDAHVDLAERYDRWFDEMNGLKETVSVVTVSSSSLSPDIPSQGMNQGTLPYWSSRFSYRVFYRMLLSL
ncbi:4a-hydroxytetrahydrobiopterin dehydratase [Bacillus sp. NTK074B]|uniref:4a-hydroxytetrahydrobiopterin dehydratase n=1 Tax=Bacillus sp. NTK074B TaxID=2802174 RepID=UPI001A8F2317|nr:4a-hydroxytetrahydrobiopterin dehydratase [Bacillus sp. NTK074B]